VKGLIYAVLLFVFGAARLHAAPEKNGAGNPVLEQARADKTKYSLFNPTPSGLLRELAADRPDKTESPYTVDAGHLQLEMDFANFTADSQEDTRLRSWNLAPINLKVGLLNNVDLQIIFGGYVRACTTDKVGNGRTIQSGVGDLVARLKINFWGNDGGKVAFAVLPFVKFPTSTGDVGNGAWEGGVIFPLAIQLPLAFEVGMETGVNFPRDERHDYQAEFINSITVGHSIAGKLSGYIEFFSSATTEPHAGLVATADAGLLYALGENIQIDGGCNFGLTGSADDFNPFTGITIRF
jgi:hypothetical protein